MDHGGVRRAPYHAVRALLAWAVENWHLVDGRSVEDPLLLPFHRLINRLHAQVVDAEWDAEDREKLDLALDWPDVRETREIERSTDMAYAAMRALGVDAEFPFMQGAEP